MIFDVFFKANNQVERFPMFFSKAKIETIIFNVLTIVAIIVKTMYRQGLTCAHNVEQLYLCVELPRSRGLTFGPRSLLYSKQVGQEILFVNLDVNSI